MNTDQHTPDISRQTGDKPEEIGVSFLIDRDIFDGVIDASGNPTNPHEQKRAEAIMSFRQYYISLIERDEQPHIDLSAEAITLQATMLAISNVEAMERKDTTVI